MQVPLRLDELGSVQFAQLCQAILGVEAVTTPWGFTAASREGLETPSGTRLTGPVLVLAAWVRDGSRSPSAAERVDEIVASSIAAAPTAPASVLLMTNVATAAEPAGIELTVVGPADLWSLVRERPSLRYRLPFLLGVADLALLVPGEAREASSGDVHAAAALARVFVPTRAYTHALGVLERHRFVVLSGPPEMGKTAIARTIGLAALSDGWELHECVRPDELWDRFSRERRQVFVADDAFGSTEYRPETAERWALELDRVLDALDDDHHLIWTSRPTPLHAALRRIHREHGVERFPQPAHVSVDAAGLEVGEKALMLFRHTRALAAPQAELELVRRHGWEIVSHPHFTPERIRRFCGVRLAGLAANDDDEGIAAAVAAEIREPTKAMAASYHALTNEHRAVLHALVDTPPGPVHERDLATAVRRHAPGGLTSPLPQIVDRLADHFLRVTGNDNVGWVHPSWRDLVIDELAGDFQARAAFLRTCGVHGVALALSTAGGSGGERTLPLLRDDDDWDVLADRIPAILPTLEAPELALLLETLAEALRHAPDSSRAELTSLADATCAELGRLWDAAAALPVPVGLLASWLSLAEELREPPPPAERALAKAWIELVPDEQLDLLTRHEVAALDDWLVLTDLLAAAAPALLDRLGFPAGQTDALRAIVASVGTLEPDLHAPERTPIVRVLMRMARVVPTLADEARAAAASLAYADALRSEPEPELRQLSPELELLLEQPLPSARDEQAIVARVLRDL